MYIRKEAYENRKKSGMCTDCGKAPRFEGKTLCSNCIEKHNLSHKHWINKVKLSGMCVSCAKRPACKNNKRCVECIEKKKISDKKHKDKRRSLGVCLSCVNPAYSNKARCLKCIEKGKQLAKNLRLKVIEAYGNKCACCEESMIEFLCIDHVNGGGGKHRKEIGNKIYRWLEKQNYPEGFQVLCWNCNSAKHFNKICPHQYKKKELIIGVA